MQPIDCKYDNSYNYDDSCYWTITPTFDYNNIDDENDKEFEYSGRSHCHLPPLCLLPKHIKMECFIVNLKLKLQNQIQEKESKRFFIHTDNRRHLSSLDIVCLMLISSNGQHWQWSIKASSSSLLSPFELSCELRYSTLSSSHFFFLLLSCFVVPIIATTITTTTSASPIINQLFLLICIVILIRFSSCRSSSFSAIFVFDQQFHKTLPYNDCRCRCITCIIISICNCDYLLLIFFVNYVDLSTISTQPPQSGPQLIKIKTKTKAPSIGECCPAVYCSISSVVLSGDQSKLNKQPKQQQQQQLPSNICKPNFPYHQQHHHHHQYHRRLFLPTLLLYYLLFNLQSTPFATIQFTDALPELINIGALFTEERLEQEIAFKLAIKRINADRIILPNSRLIPKVERIKKHDSFHADKKVCGLLRTGVVAIFDPLDGHISRHLQSICDALDIPHIETRWDFNLKRDDLSINLYPRPLNLAKAYVDIVKGWGWEQFAIVYEDNEGLIRLQDFFKEAQGRNWRIKLHQFMPGKPYRETFWRIKNDGEYNIILDVKNENIFRALKHAQQVGLITEAHSYLITQLDLHTIDLEDFKFGKTKISAFKIIDNSNEELRLLMDDWKREYPDNLPIGEIGTESALIYDAVKLLATAIQDLDQSQSIEIQQVSCENGAPWAHGSSLINYMRPITFRGITGLVGFNDLGFRSSITLNVVTVSQTGLNEVGTWSEDANPDKRLNISRDWTVQYSSSALENKTLIITTILNDPYTMIKDSSFKRTGNDQFEGYAIDLIAELAKILHFKYEFHLVKDGSYGRPDKNGLWNGMMGELIRGEADLAVADLTITSKREDAVDFTHPFMNTGISILFKKPTKKVTSLFSFLSPFSKVVWIYVMCAYIGISSMLFIVGRLSPYEWENPHPCRHDEQVLENSFSLSNSFFFTIGSLMQQACDLTPKAMSTRTIAGIWYFFTLIMIASYTANLAAFLTVEKIVYPIENAEGLASQDKIKYGCLASGSTASFFSESNIITYKRMWEFMSKFPEVLKRSNEEGRKAVEKGDGNYAYLMESASIEYTIERNCNLTQIGGLIDSKNYGVATRKDSPYRTPLSQAILKLQESGELLILKERWWKQKKGGGQCIDDAKKSSGSVTPLKIDNVGGVFVVLLGGLSFSLFVAILEFVWKSRREELKPESVCEEMINDLKFAFLCQSSSKFVKPSVPMQPSSVSSSPDYHHPHYQYHQQPPPLPLPISHHFVDHSSPSPHSHRRTGGSGGHSHRSTSILTGNASLLATPTSYYPHHISHSHVPHHHSNHSQQYHYHSNGANGGTISANDSSYPYNPVVYRQSHSGGGTPKSASMSNSHSGFTIAAQLQLGSSKFSNKFVDASATPTATGTALKSLASNSAGTNKVNMSSGQTIQGQKSNSSNSLTSIRCISAIPVSTSVNNGNGNVVSSAARVPLYHFDDCALVTGSTGSVKVSSASHNNGTTLNYLPPLVALSGGSNAAQVRMRTKTGDTLAGSRASLSERQQLQQQLIRQKHRSAPQYKSNDGLVSVLKGSRQSRGGHQAVSRSLNAQFQTNDSYDNGFYGNGGIGNGSRGCSPNLRVQSNSCSNLSSQDLVSTVGGCCSTVTGISGNSGGGSGGHLAHISNCREKSEESCGSGSGGVGRVGNRQSRRNAQSNQHPHYSHHHHSHQTNQTGNRTNRLINFKSDSHSLED